MGNPHLVTANDVHDVVVIGAGISGIAAARHILDARQNTDVLVLEARERAGGRIHTITSKDGEPIEIGAAWVHGGANESEI